MPWVIRLLCLGLFTDIILISSKSVGILDWAQGTEPDLNIGWIIFALLSFCATVGLLMPIILFVLKALVIYLPISREHAFSDQTNYVPLLMVKDEALKKESPFLLEYHDQGEQKLLSANRERQTFADLIACLLLFCAVDNWLSLLPTGKNALVPSLWNASNVFLQCVWTFIIITGLGIILYAWNELSSKQIYHPPLAAKANKNKTL